jgi:hypothetical protein
MQGLTALQKKLSRSTNTSTVATTERDARMMIHEFIPGQVPVAGQNTFGARGGQLEALGKPVLPYPPA